MTADAPNSILTFDRWFTRRRRRTNSENFARTGVDYGQTFHTEKHSQSAREVWVNGATLEGGGSRS